MAAPSPSTPGGSRGGPGPLATTAPHAAEPKPAERGPVEPPRVAPSEATTPWHGERSPRDDSALSEIGSPLDAGPLDAGPLDAGPLDAGPLDAGPLDSAQRLAPSSLEAERRRIQHRSVQPRVGPRPFEIEPPRDRAPLLMGLGIVTTLLLLWSFLLPSNPGAVFRGGWEDVADLGGLSFLAALFSGGLILLLALPLRTTQRASLLALVGVLLLAFGLYHLEEDLLRTLYRNHPALQFVVLDSPGALTAALLALLFPAGLVGRAAEPDAIAPRVLAVVGVVALVALYLVVDPPGKAGTGLGALMDVLHGADTLRGDRLAAWLALGPLALAPCALLVFLPSDRGAPTVLFGVLAEVFIAGVLFALAAHVAKPSHWLDALPVVKTALLFASGLLLGPSALGYATARIGAA